MKQVITFIILIFLLINLFNWGFNFIVWNAYKIGFERGDALGYNTACKVIFRKGKPYGLWNVRGGEKRLYWVWDITHKLEEK